MKYISLLTPRAGQTMAAFEPYIVAEEQAVWTLYLSGVIRELYFQPEPLQIVLVFEAMDRAEVEHHLSTLPMVAAGLFDSAIVELGPWRMFEALFDPVNRTKS